MTEEVGGKQEAVPENDRRTSAESCKERLPKAVCFKLLRVKVQEEKKEGMKTWTI